MATGSAPISPHVLNFFRVTGGCYVIEGFGATETSGISGAQIVGDPSLSNVGPPLLCCNYKLADVNEMGIVAQRDQKGEVTLK
jgi:long-chain acyl-CoA synthetase